MDLQVNDINRTDYGIKDDEAPECNKTVLFFKRVSTNIKNRDSVCMLYCVFPRPVVSISFLPA